MDALLFELVCWCFLPSIVFWLWAGGLHLCGANTPYQGKVSVYEMMRTQILVDVLQTVGGLLRLFVLHETRTEWAVFKIVLGLVGVDLMEYCLHRNEHRLDLLRDIHKQHHRLLQVHTLGTFYNDWRQTLFDAFWLGSLIFLLDLTIVEVAIVSSISIVFTVHDHWPSKKGSIPTRHERHHSFATPNADFSQPFSGIWDYVFGTRVEDVYMTNAKKKLM